VRDCHEQQSEKWEGQNIHSFHFSGKMKRENDGKVEKNKRVCEKMCFGEREGRVVFITKKTS